MESGHSIYRVYGMIGPAGVALTFLAVMAVALILKNWIYLFLTGRDFKKAAASMSQATGAMDSLLRRYAKNAVIGIIGDVLKTHGRHSNDLKAEVAYLFHLHFSRTQRDLSVLRIIALISPMLGLLGTLLGLSGVFRALSVSTTLNTSTILAAGIWEAILTTIMGLTLAIPALIACYLFRLKLKGFHLAAIEYGYRFLDSRPEANHKFGPKNAEALMGKAADEPAGKAAVG